MSETAQLTPVFVRASGAGWELVDRETGAADSYATRDAALEAARSVLSASVKPAYLRDEVTRAAVGAWRWLDATAVEDVDGGDAPRIDEGAIESMAARLNASSMARPIDGGPGSVVHGTAHDTGTPANGWAHLGVPVVHPDGRLHLYVYGELLPEIARELDRGRLAHGSVHVRGDSVDETGAILGAELASHALTNDPVVQTLMPASALMSAGCRAVVLLSRGTMARKPTAAKSESNADPEEIMADGAMTLEEAMAKIAELEARLAEMSAAMDGSEELEAAKSRAATLEAKVGFLEAELAAARSQVESPEVKAAKAVDAAIAAGHVAPTSREKALVLAKAGLDEFLSVVSSQRVVPVVKQAKPNESQASKSTAVDPADPLVQMLRSAGLSDEGIRKTLAKKGR